jgi:hypothetical protein
MQDAKNLMSELKLILPKKKITLNPVKEPHPKQIFSKINLKKCFWHNICK